MKDLYHYFYENRKTAVLITILLAILGGKFIIENNIIQIGGNKYTNNNTSFVGATCQGNCENSTINNQNTYNVLYYGDYFSSNPTETQLKSVIFDNFNCKLYDTQRKNKAINYGCTFTSFPIEISCSKVFYKSGGSICNLYDNYNKIILPKTLIKINNGANELYFDNFVLDKQYTFKTCLGTFCVSNPDYIYNKTRDKDICRILNINYYVNSTNNFISNIVETQVVNTTNFGNCSTNKNVIFTGKAYPLVS